MGFEKIIQIVASLFLVGCDSEPEIRPRDTGSEGRSEDLFMFKEELIQQCPKSCKPVEFLELNAKDQIDVFIRGPFPKEVGVVIKDGYVFTKKYPADQPVLTVSSRKFPNLKFSTSYSSFFKFPPKRSEKELIEVKNNSQEILFIMVYEKLLGEQE